MSPYLIIAVLIGLGAGAVAAAIFQHLKRAEASAADFRERRIRTFFTTGMVVASLAYVLLVQMGAR